jgi:hypothetical protein
MFQVLFQVLPDACTSSVAATVNACAAAAGAAKVKCAELLSA